MTKVWQKTIVSTVLVGALLAAHALHGRAQQTDAPARASLGQQAVGTVLKHYSLNPLALDSKTGQPLPRDGKWSVGKTMPAVCPQTGPACAEVFYEVPAESVRCSWVVLLNPDGTDGKFLDEDDDTERYMLLKVSTAEAKDLVATRKKPTFPPIAKAAQVSGAVSMGVLVGKGGNVEKVALLSGPPMEQQSSLDAARNWIFRPMVVGTRAVPYEVQLVFTYRTSGPSNASVEVAP
jgi:hypothetical protein